MDCRGVCCLRCCPCCSCCVGFPLVGPEFFASAWPYQYGTLSYWANPVMDAHESPQGFKWDTNHTARLPPPDQIQVDASDGSDLTRDKRFICDYPGEFYFQK